LEFVVQLCSNAKITATIVRIAKSESHFDSNPIDKPVQAYTTGKDEQETDGAAATANMRLNGLTMGSMTGQPDTVYGQFTTQTRLHSETADNIIWAKYASQSEGVTPHSSRVLDALTRITFDELGSPIPLQTVIEQTNAQLEYARQLQKSLIVVLGRSRRLAVENHMKELKEMVEAQGGIGSEVKKTVGDVATAVIVSGCNVSLVVVQAATQAD